MRLGSIIVLQPLFDDNPCFGHGTEHPVIQTRELGKRPGESNGSLSPIANVYCAFALLAVLHVVEPVLPVRGLWLSSFLHQVMRLAVIPVWKIL